MRSANACLHIFAKNNLTAGNISDPFNIEVQTFLWMHNYVYEIHTTGPYFTLTQ